MTKKTKKTIIETLKISSKDVGSSEVQIGLLSEKINNLTTHFEKNKNDRHSTRGLVQAVNPDTVTAPVQIKGAGGTSNGTGKIMWQSVDNTGNRSDIITITVSINGQA